MRHEKAENLLQLAVMMAGRGSGVSLQDIEQAFGVSRRTAERMRDAVVRLLPETMEGVDDDGFKRWRLDSSRLNRITDISATDIADLHAAAEALRQANRGQSADRLDSLASRLLAVQTHQRRARLEPDVEALLEAEGIASHPGPKLHVDPGILLAIREAILACRTLRITYAGRANPAPREMTVAPYGVLYGLRPYLVGRVSGFQDVRHFRLQGILSASLTNEAFVRDPSFCLKAHSGQAFGTFMEEPIDVCWRFTGSAADEAAQYIFHPSQRQEWEPDGSLLVRFRAGGILEMSWHLQTWGDAVEVVSPPDFWWRAEKCARTLKELPRLEAAESREL